MKKLMEQLRRFTLIKTLIYIALGLFILINPALVFTSIIYIIAGYLTIIGIINLVQGIQQRQGGTVVNPVFIIGVMYLLGALITLLFAKTIVSFLPVLLGIVVVLNGLLQWGSVNGPVKEVNPRFTLGSRIYSIILILAGLLIIFNPFTSLLVLFRVFGGVLVMMGVAEIVGYFILPRL